jgi:hypothetical protein
LPVQSDAQPELLPDPPLELLPDPLLELLPDPPLELLLLLAGWHCDAHWLGQAVQKQLPTASNSEAAVCPAVVTHWFTQV